jgi:hypothetical protein
MGCNFLKGARGDAANAVLPPPARTALTAAYDAPLTVLNKA